MKSLSIGEIPETIAIQTLLWQSIELQDEVENQVEVGIEVGKKKEFENAIKLALHINIELAKEILRKISNDDDIKKSLWLLIVEKTLGLKSDVDIRNTLQLLDESEGILGIEDILPLLPDDIDITLLKDDICKALQKNSTVMGDLQLKMEEISESADGITK
eukprot:gene15174-32167_t